MRDAKTTSKGVEQTAHKSHASIGDFRRLLSTYGSPPTKKLTKYIQKRDWNGAQSRLLSYPWDAHYRSTSSNQSTPLHHALRLRGPIELVKLLSEANPSALLSQDSEGWTPVHIVLLYGADEEVVLYVIRCGGSRALSVTSRIAGSPLHLACRHGSSLRVLKELLDTNPDMISSGTESGLRPVEVLWKEFNRRAEQQRSTNDSVSLDSPQVNDLVEKLKIFVEGLRKKHGEKRSYLIHDVLKFQADMGDIGPLLEVLVKLFPSQARSFDRDGSLAIHIAASNIRTHRKELSGYGYAADRKDTIEILIDAFPGSASIETPGGELPIHVAMGRGKRTWNQGLRRITQDHPDALLARQKDSTLLPFQLAATLACLDEDNDEVENESMEVEVLTSVLELLRACPHALAQ